MTLTLHNISFVHPWILWLLLLLPFIAVYYFWKNKKAEPALSFSSFENINKIPKSIASYFIRIPFFLRLIAIGFFIVALARPVSFLEGEDIYSEGIDIALVLDISGSMLAKDFTPDRLQAAKDVIGKFIDRRHSDRIGLVIFSKEAFTQCPLTVDYSILKNFLGQVKSGIITDGTAIGNAIANGVNRLKDSDVKSKVIILLTDGMNNAGEVNPITAAEIAKTFNIKIYTIGVGTRGTAMYPVQTPFGIDYRPMPVEIDEDLLQNVSAMTGGKYYRATDNKKLESIYNEIDRLEKTKVEVTSYRNAKQLFGEWLLLGIIFLCLEQILSNTILRKLP